MIGAKKVYGIKSKQSLMWSFLKVGVLEQELNQVASLKNQLTHLKKFMIKELNGEPMLTIH